MVLACAVLSAASRGWTGLLSPHCKSSRPRRIRTPSLRNSFRVRPCTAIRAPAVRHAFTALCPNLCRMSEWFYSDWCVLSTTDRLCGRESHKVAHTLQSGFTTSLSRASHAHQHTQQLSAVLHARTRMLVAVGCSRHRVHKWHSGCCPASTATQHTCVCHADRPDQP